MKRMGQEVNVLAFIESAVSVPLRGFGYETWLAGHPNMRKLEQRWFPSPCGDLVMKLPKNIKLLGVSAN